MSLFGREFSLTMLLFFIWGPSGGNAQVGVTPKPRKYLRDIGNTTLAEVEAELAKEFAGHIPEGRIQEWMKDLESMFMSLPKNSQGRVGQQTVRYALQRLFVSRRGWSIRGLDADVSEADWVPNFVQARIADHIGSKAGMDLHELGTFAAVLEDLVTQESGKRLIDIYKVLALPTDSPIPRDLAEDAFTTYTMVHLLNAKRNISLGDRDNTAFLRKVFAASYENYNGLQAFFSPIKDKYLSPTSNDSVPFDTMRSLIQEFGEQFGTFTAPECRMLKAALLTHEGRGRGIGRVKLSDFYNMSSYTRWRLQEKVDFLRDLGALDESNASFLQVIVPNYVQSRSNCLDATPLYSVCCRDECEDLIATLERDISPPKATPGRIAKLVATMSTDTVAASVDTPRVLSESLLNRLQDIAASHFGTVDMHSRLFAQWMHHAFPRECPFPHASGTTNPLSADEWMKTKGHESQLASATEIEDVLNQSCSTEDDADTVLEWSTGDELFEPIAPPMGALPWLAFFTIVLWGMLAVYLGRFRTGLGKATSKLLYKFVFVVFLAGGAIALDLMDKTVIGGVVISGLVVDLILFYGQKNKYSDKEMALPKTM